MLQQVLPRSLLRLCDLSSCSSSLLAHRNYSVAPGTGSDSDKQGPPSPSGSPNTNSPRPETLLKLFSDASSASIDLEATSRPSTSQNTDLQASSQPKSQHDVVRVILEAIDNCKPLMKVLPMKTKARVLYVPKPASVGEQRSLAVRWIVEAASKRQKSSDSSMAESLAMEILLAFQKKGSARQKREDLHKQAIENKANIMLKWW